MGSFLVFGGHPGGGLPQSTPMPEKPTISQVVPGITWISDRVGLCVHTPLGYLLYGGMNIVELG